MRLRVENKTEWRSDHLRAIILRAVADYYDELTLIVEVRTVHRRNGHNWVGGHAPYNSRWFQLDIPTDDSVDPREVAKVAAHEAAHCMGITHRQMSESYRELTWRGNWREKFAWAADYPMEKRKPATQKPRITGLSAAEAKHDHAIAMLKKADTRLKRAKTIRTKWAKKVTYYRGRMASLKTNGGDDGLEERIR